MKLKMMIFLFLFLSKCLLIKAQIISLFSDWTPFSTPSQNINLQILPYNKVPLALVGKFEYWNMPIVEQLEEAKTSIETQQYAVGIKFYSLGVPQKIKFASTAHSKSNSNIVECFDFGPKRKFDWKRGFFTSLTFQKRVSKVITEISPLVLHQGTIHADGGQLSGGYSLRLGSLWIEISTALNIHQLSGTGFTKNTEALHNVNLFGKKNIRTNFNPLLVGIGIQF